jgi:hypothetical protein
MIYRGYPLPRLITGGYILIDGALIGEYVKPQEFLLR